MFIIGARELITLLAALIFAAPLGAQAPVDFGRFHALVIGNNDYQHLPKLTTAEADAKEVASLLQDKYGFSVTPLKNATRTDIMRALNRLREELTERDNLLIYYAGHGSLDKATNTGYWQPVDAEPNDLTFWIPTTVITTALTAMNAKHILVVADSCYAGALLTRDPGTKLRTGTERQVWLRRMASKGSRTALTSGGLEPVQDLGGYGHSVFARAFLDVLGDNEDILDGDRLFDRLKHAVVLKARQTPRYADISSPKHEDGDFLLVPRPLQETQIDVETRKPPNSWFRGTQETEFWRSIKDSNDPAYFQAYLHRFPQGTFSELARRKLEKLERSAPPEVPDAGLQPQPSPAQIEAALGLTREQRRVVQQGLNRRGFDSGPTDGVFGSKTRAAITRFQQSRGNAATGYLTTEQWRDLKAEVRGEPQGLLGIVIQELTADLAESFDLDQHEGILVAQVVEGSPAAIGGLRQGDVITAYQGEAVTDVGAFQNRVALTAPGSRAQIRVLRDGQRRNLAVTIGTFTKDMLASWGASHYSEALGLTVQTLAPQLAEHFSAEPGEGVAVTAVAKGSIAASAGLERGTVILQVNRKPVNDAAAFERAIEQSPGNRVLLLTRRKDGIQRFLTLNR